MRAMSGAKRKSSSADSKSSNVTTSQVSRSSKNALLCKKRDKFMCQYYTDNEYAQTKQLKAAHIYEIEELKAISDYEKRTRILA
jgi:hypothetical protein